MRVQRSSLWAGATLGGLLLVGTALADLDEHGAVRSLQERKSAVEAELAGLGDERQGLKARLREHARALYRLERGGLLPLSGGLEALLRHAGNLRRLEGLVVDDLDALRALEQKGRDLRAETSRIARQVAQAEHAQRQARQVEARRQAEQTREDQFQAAFRDSRGPTGRTLRTTSGTLSLVDDEPLPTRFPDQRGNLALPISGPNEIRDAHRADSDGAGLELVGRAGATVRASEAGRVAFSDVYESYGRIVILDHGDRYYTVYAGFEQVDVRVGDDVSRSARLGSVGGDGVLYFEVRRGTRNQAPRAWLGL